MKEEKEVTREQQIDYLKDREVVCIRHRRYATLCVLPDAVIWVCDGCGPSLISRAPIKPVEVKA